MHPLAEEKGELIQAAKTRKNKSVKERKQWGTQERKGKRKQ